jgi:hypothetical protein
VWFWFSFPWWLMTLSFFACVYRPFVLYSFVLFYEAGSHYVVQAGLKLPNLLPQTRECWDYEHVPLRPALYLLDVCSDKFPIFSFGYLSFYYLIVIIFCYSVHTNLSLNMWFANIFSHSVACLFTFLMVSFETTKYLILMKFNLSIFFLWFLVLLVS